MNVHNTKKKQRSQKKICLRGKEKNLQAMRITKTGFFASKMVCSTVPYSRINTEKTTSDMLAIQWLLENVDGIDIAARYLQPASTSRLCISPSSEKITCSDWDASERTRTEKKTTKTPYMATAPTMIVNWTTQRVALMNNRFSSPSPKAIDSAPIWPETKPHQECQHRTVLLLCTTLG